MGLFNFLRKKPEPGNTEVNGIKALNNGILFEDDSVFLPWESPIEQGNFYIKKEYRADRLIYHWGERRILNGLVLDLKTVSWNHLQDGSIRKFSSIEFSAEGESTEGFFKLIADHLNVHLGPAKSSEDNLLSLEWKMGGARLILELLDRHGLKLNFLIEKRY